MLRKLLQLILPPSGHEDSGGIAGVLAVWLLLVSGTTWLSLIEAFQ